MNGPQDKKNGRQKLLCKKTGLNLVYKYSHIWKPDAQNLYTFTLLHLQHPVFRWFGIHIAGLQSKNVQKPDN